jgi:hypothetical protein
MLFREFDDGIRYLREVLPVTLGKHVEEACRENLRLHPRPERTAPGPDAGPHEYTFDTRICDGREAELVFREMLQDGRASAPTSSSAPVHSHKVDVLWPMHDMIVRFVDQASRTIYNVTLPRHVFFPGFVKLVVRERAAQTFVVVTGKGTGSLRTANGVLAPTLFTTLLERYLAPRVERRLKAVGRSRS